MQINCVKKKKKVCFNGLCACVCGGEKRAEKVCCSMFLHQQEGSLKNAPKKKSTECRTGILTEERENYNKNQPHFGVNLAGKSLFLWILI